MKNHKRIHQITLLAILTAIVIIFTFTPIGYIKIGLVEITLLVVPVAIGAVILGPKGGAFLGFMFGFLSFILSLTGMSTFGTMLISINPFYAFLLFVPTRTLMGLCSGLIFRGLNRVVKHDIIAHIVACVSAAALNTLFFMTTFCIFFYQTKEIQDIASTFGTTNVLAFCVAFVGVNGLVELIVNFIIGAAVSKTLYTIYKKKNPDVIEDSRPNNKNISQRRHLRKR